MKESILKEHPPLTGEIPPIIVVMTVDYREEGDILMREEDPQRERERDTQGSGQKTSKEKRITQ